MKKAEPKTKRNFRTRSRRARERKSSEPMMASLAPLVEEKSGEVDHADVSTGVANASEADEH